MGDRYYLDTNCAYCSHNNKDIYYAPTCGAGGYCFLCENCHKVNFIQISNFQAKKVEDVTDKEVLDAFWAATNVSWENEEEVEQYRKCEAEIIRHLNDICDKCKQIKYCCSCENEEHN